MHPESLRDSWITHAISHNWGSQLTSCTLDFPSELHTDKEINLETILLNNLSKLCFQVSITAVQSGALERDINIFALFILF